MIWWFPNKASGFAAAAMLGMLGCAGHHPAAPPEKKAAAHPGHPSKEDMALEGVSIAHDFFLRARRMEMDGNDAVALGYFRIAYEYDPTSRDLCFILVDHLKDAGRVDSAVQLGKRCLALKGPPTSAEYQSLGEAYLRQDDVPHATECYRKAVALDEDDKDALYTLAGLYEKAEDWPHYSEIMEKLLPRLEYPPRLVEKQLQVYRKIYRPEGNSEASISLLKSAWESTQNTAFGESLAAYYEAQDLPRPFLAMAEALAKGNPENPGYGLMRAEALNACHLPDSALSVYRSLLAQSPEEREILFPYAALLQELGRLEESHQVFKKLVKAYPQHPVYQYFLGSTGLELHQPDSRAALQKAATLEPAVPDYWARLAYADLVFGHDTAAAEDLRHAPDTVAEPWQTPFFQGMVHALLARQLEPQPDSQGESPMEKRNAGEKKPELRDSSASRSVRLKAVDFFREALRLSPDNRRVLFELGTGLERVGQRDSAAATLKKLVQVDTANAVALNYLGYMLVEDNRELDFAGALIDRALKLEPQSGAYLDSKGWWFYRKGDFTSARNYLRQALERMPKDPTILEHLATVQKRMDNPPEGKSAP